ncbi:MAG: M23 family metallopeptidase [Arcobacteraceae bacterium]|nr:M23 family metallopeptidase [Arcobacteraceae bacterium]
MIFRVFFIFLLIFSSSFASIRDLDNKIKTNKKQYKSVASKKYNLNKNIHTLASKIMQEEKSYQKNNVILKKINTKLILNKLKLSNSIKQFQELKEKSIHLREDKSQIELDVVEFVIERYSMSLGIKQTNKKLPKDIIGKEVYTLIFENAKEEVLNLNVDYLKVNNAIRHNVETTNKLNLFIKEQYRIQAQYMKMKKDQEEAIESLKLKHKLYKNRLIKIVSKQNKITDLLGSLNILKKKEIKAARLRVKKAKEKLRKKALLRKKKELAKQKRLKKEKKIKELESKNIRLSSAKDLNIKVRNLGSSAKGIKILKYKGKKTIAPLKSYTITKKFGKYYDAVYKMELFNESVSLKTKKENAKVLNVFKGEIVYAKQNSGLLENVVIVKHRNNLHTIYSHLDKISPTIKVGKWIPKGYVVGRINDTLLFQATKNSKYINPTRLFK